jgi:hypothetical protein
MQTIKSEFVLIQTVGTVGGKPAYVHQVGDSASDIPRDSDGNPTVACIDGQILPEAVISESGTSITFVLRFRPGTAWFHVGNGPLAALTKYEMTGWSYGIDITLDLIAVEKEDINNTIVVPPLVESQLTGFLDNMFSVSSLFMDFQSTDLMRFDPRTPTRGRPATLGSSRSCCS